MREEKEQTQVSFQRANRAFQIGCAVLILGMGALLLTTLILQAPELLQGLSRGEKAALDAITSNVAGVGVC